MRTATRTAIGRPPRLPTLGDVVERLWYVEDPACGGDEIKLPTSTPQVVLNLESDLLTTRDVRAPHHVRTSGAVGLAPLATRAVILDRSEQRRSVGIVLRPEAFSVTAGGSPHGLPPLVDLATLRGHAVSELAEKAAACATGSAALDVVEAEFARLVADAARPDPLARNAVALLSKGVRVSAVADQVGLTAGSLTRRFRAATGLSPKRYQRLLRLDGVVRDASTRPSAAWDELAARHGFFDQAHLTNEFSDLIGLTPGQWRRIATSGPFHLPVDDAFLQDKVMPGS